MIAKCLVGAVALALSTPASMSAGTQFATMNDGMPPVRFQGDAAAVVVFTDRAGIDAACGIAPPPYRIIACHRTADNGVSVVFMPNACPTGNTEFYAKIMCHEMGHAQGWSGDHEA